jgi:hypothetical protein
VGVRRRPISAPGLKIAALSGFLLDQEYMEKNTFLSRVAARRSGLICIFQAERHSLWREFLQA